MYTAPREIEATVHARLPVFLQRSDADSEWFFGKSRGADVDAAALERAIAADGVILGLCGMTEYPPLAEGGVNVPGTVRKRLGLYANLRPARARGDQARADSAACTWGSRASPSAPR